MTRDLDGVDIDIEGIIESLRAPEWQVVRSECAVVHNERDELLVDSLALNRLFESLV